MLSRGHSWGQEALGGGLLRCQALSRYGHLRSWFGPHCLDQEHLSHPTWILPGYFSFLYAHWYGSWRCPTVSHIIPFLAYWSQQIFGILLAISSISLPWMRTLVEDQNKHPYWVQRVGCVGFRGRVIHEIVVTSQFSLVNSNPWWYVAVVCSLSLVAGYWVHHSDTM